MDQMINSISISVLENEILEYNMYKIKYHKYQKMCRNVFMRCFVIQKKNYFEKKYKSKLFYLKMKYTYNDVYLRYFKGIEDTDILENILKNKQLVENPLNTNIVPINNQENMPLVHSNTISEYNNEIRMTQQYIPTATPTATPTPTPTHDHAVAVRLQPSAPYKTQEDYNML